MSDSKKPPTQPTTESKVSPPSKPSTVPPPPAAAPPPAQPPKSDNNNENIVSNKSNPTSAYKPPFDIAWHHLALQKIAPTNQRVKGEAENAVNNVVGSMTSPLAIGQTPCNDEHNNLLTCIDEARKKADGGDAKVTAAVEQNGLFRQKLTLASETNSKRYAQQVEEMSMDPKTLPSRMPRSRLGAMIQPCYKKVELFRKCVDDSVGDWYEHLTKVHSASQK